MAVHAGNEASAIEMWLVLILEVFKAETDFASDSRGLMHNLEHHQHSPKPPITALADGKHVFQRKM